MRKIPRWQIEKIFGKYLTEPQYADIVTELELDAKRFKSRYRDSHSLKELEGVLRAKWLYEMEEAMPEPKKRKVAVRNLKRRRYPKAGIRRGYGKDTLPPRYPVKDPRIGL